MRGLGLDDPRLAIGQVTYRTNNSNDIRASALDLSIDDEELTMSIKMANSESKLHGQSLNVEKTAKRTKLASFLVVCMGASVQRIPGPAEQLAQVGHRCLPPLAPGSTRL